MLTFEDFLRSQMGNAIDFSLRVSEPEAGKLTFYIHPANVDGETLDFEVEGNNLKLVQRAGDSTPPEPAA